LDNNFGEKRLERKVKGGEGRGGKGRVREGRGGKGREEEWERSNFCV
jgi:hypothetical protein